MVVRLSDIRSKTAKKCLFCVFRPFLSLCRTASRPYTVFLNGRVGTRLQKRKKNVPSWGSNPQNETKPEEIYDNERACDRKIVLSFLLDFRPLTAMMDKN